MKASSSPSGEAFQISGNYFSFHRHFNIIQNHLPHTLAYADDTQLYLSFRLDESSNELEAWNAMEGCVRAVWALMITDKLKLNKSKTEFMIIGTQQQLSKINRITLLVGRDRVESVTEARSLGVLCDCNFNFCNHNYYLNK